MCALNGVCDCRKWAFEKLVFANCDYGWAPKYSQKYILKPRSAWATGVHFCEHLKEGNNMLDVGDDKLRLYHYHGVIPIKAEVNILYPDRHYLAPVEKWLENTLPLHQ